MRCELTRNPAQTTGFSLRMNRELIFIAALGVGLAGVAGASDWSYENFNSRSDKTNGGTTIGTAQGQSHARHGRRYAKHRGHGCHRAKHQAHHPGGTHRPDTTPKPEAKP